MKSLSPLVCNASSTIYLCESILYLYESVSRLLILSSESICPSAHCLYYYSVIISLDIWQKKFPHLIILQTCSIYSWPLHLYKNFNMGLSSSVKNLIEILIGMVLYLWINLERSDIFTILHLPAHEHGISLYLGRSSFIDISDGYGILWNVYQSGAQRKTDPLHPNWIKIPDDKSHLCS